MRWRHFALFAAAEFHLARPPVTQLASLLKSTFGYRSFRPLQREICEATLAGRLHHRNLVAVTGFGVADGRYYAVMEYVDGGDLAALLDVSEAAAPPLIQKV